MIIFKQISYINKANKSWKEAKKLIKEKKVEGISEIRDESGI